MTSSTAPLRNGLLYTEKDWREAASMPLKIAPRGPEKYFTSQNEAYAYDLLLHVVPQDNSSTFFGCLLL